MCDVHPDSMSKMISIFFNLVAPFELIEGSYANRRANAIFTDVIRNANGSPNYSCKSRALSLDTKRPSMDIYFTSLPRKVFKKIHHGRQCQYSKKALFGNETRNLLRVADFSYYVRSLGRSGSGSCTVYTYIVGIPMVWKRMFVRGTFLL